MVPWLQLYHELSPSRDINSNQVLHCESPGSLSDSSVERCVYCTEIVLWRQLLCDPLTFKIKQTEVEPVNNGALRNFSWFLSYGLQSPVSPCLLAAVPWAVKGSLPEAAQPAERWCNSPGPGGGGHWAWLPLWPCASPPTAVSRWLLPAPETPPFPGNAAVANRGTWQSGTRQIGRSSKFKSFKRDIILCCVQRLQSFQHFD